MGLYQGKSIYETQPGTLEELKLHICGAMRHIPRDVLQAMMHCMVKGIEKLKTVHGGHIEHKLWISRFSDHVNLMDTIALLTLIPLACYWHPQRFELCTVKV